MREWSFDRFSKIQKAGGNHVVVLSLICVWFLCLTWPTLSIGFHLDDISNLYRGWEPSWRELLAANLTPFSTIYRPFGGLYYRAVYSMGGLNPFYFRLITFCLLTLNIGLVFRLARRMFGQTSVAMIGALIFCAHPNMTDLFRNNGTSYDVLCCTFFLLAVLVYDNARQSGHALSWRTAAILTILFVLAENSKEMGLALPFVLGAYEFWFRIAKDRFGQWEYPVLLIGLAVLAVIAARIKAGAGSILHGHPEYVPTFTIDVLSTNTRRALEWFASLKQDSMPQNLAWLILAAAAVVIAVSRNWRIAFAFSAALLSAVPVLFIPWRGLFVFYIPYAFISIMLAGLFSEALQRLPAPQLRLALTTAVILFICVKQWPIRSRIDGPAEQRVIRHLIWQLDRIQKGPPAGGSVLMLNTLHDSEWIPMMLARLRFDDKSLWASSMDAGKCEAQRRYDLVVDFARRNDPVLNRSVLGSDYCPAGK